MKAPHFTQNTVNRHSHTVKEGGDISTKINFWTQNKKMNKLHQKKDWQYMFGLY